MSRLADCAVYDFRNIGEAAFRFNTGLNVFYGENGSGKTSLIEALHHLSVARSFRTHLSREVIARGQPYFTLRATFTDGSSRALQKHSNGQREIRLSGQRVTELESFAQTMPVILVYQSIYQIMDAGSKLRRGVIDFGLFHVKQSYLTHWRAYKRALSQRNALLKTSSASSNDFASWEQALVEHTLVLTELRTDYISALECKFQNILGKISELSLSLLFKPGFTGEATASTLMQQYQELRGKDKLAGFTSAGAHRADFIMQFCGRKAKGVLSRGQQKVALIALKLAQAELMSERCLFLLDDLSAELDDKHLQAILTYFTENNHQVVITCLQPLSFP